MTRRRAALVLILAAFALLGALRLNRFCLLEPDSPGYLFQSRALATFHGYREIDHPGEPLHTFRPPGLPLLLAPLSLVAPFSVTGAKTIVLLFAIAALALAWRLAARGGGETAALVAVAVIASSPYALLHATEVVSEFPYLALSLAAILVTTREDRAPGKRDVVVLAVALGFLPFLRTIGIALVGAIALWCLLDRARRPWLPAPLAAAVATGLWALRNHLASGPTYFGAIAHAGVSGLARRSVDAAGFYITRFLDVLLPGFWPGRPLYERLTIAGTPDLGGLHGAAWIVAAGVLGLALLGAWRRRREEGALIALYALLFGAVLVVYPPRHERLTWPLVPLVVALVPAGVAAIGRRAAAWATLAAACALVVWQSAASIAIVRDNGVSRSAPERFYGERVPPLYFADWQAAGRWLASHARSSDRVLTRHSDTGFTSGLLQDSIRFEELPPAAWRARIGKTGARWLVVPTSLFGKFFPMDLLRSDPVYSYEVAWSGGDVAVIAVAPNRTGAVLPPAPPDAATLDACDAALRREPGRVDLESRCAELLAAAGKPDEAIKRLQTVVAGGRADVRIEIALGQLLLDVKRDAEALQAFKAAAAMPEADLLEQTIARGTAAAAELAAANGIDKTVRAHAAVARARRRMEDLRWADALRLVDEALVFAPYDPLAVSAAGDVALRRQEFGAAVSLYDQAGREGDAEAAARSRALAQTLRTEAALATSDAASIVSAAAFGTQTGTPGRALDLLERASAARPGEPAFQEPLAELRRFYGVN